MEGTIDTIKVLDIEGAWAEVIDTESYIKPGKDGDGYVILYVTSRVHYTNKESRKEAFRRLKDKGWKKSVVRSDDFILKKVLREELYA